MHSPTSREFSSILNSGYFPLNTKVENNPTEDVRNRGYININTHTYLFKEKKDNEFCLNLIIDYINGFLHASILVIIL